MILTHCVIGKFIVYTKWDLNLVASQWCKYRWTDCAFSQRVTVSQHKKSHWKRHNCNIQNFLLNLVENFLFFEASLGKTFNTWECGKSFWNKTVWLELDKTYTHIDGFWNWSLKTSDVVFARNNLCSQVTAVSTWLVQIKTVVDWKDHGKAPWKFPGLKVDSIEANVPSPMSHQKK